MSFRTRGHGRSAKHFPITPPQGTAFGPAEHRDIAKDVYAGSVGESRESVRKLERDFREAKTPAKKEQIRKATQLEANRLDIGAHNSRNSAEARKSLAARSRIFDRAAERMGRKLRAQRDPKPDAGVRYNVEWHNGPGPDGSRYFSSEGAARRFEERKRKQGYNADIEAHTNVHTYRGRAVPQATLTRGNMSEVFVSFDDASARNAETELKKAGIPYRVKKTETGGHPMVEFYTYERDRPRAHEIIDREVNFA